MMYNHKVVRVTGASSGIGKCCAEDPSQQGYRVYGTSRRTDSTLSEQRCPDTNMFKMIQMDVTDESSVIKGIDYIMARESGINVVVNNAGIARLINKIIQMNSPRLRFTVGASSQRMAVPLKKILPSRLFESLISSRFQAN